MKSIFRFVLVDQNNVIMRSSNGYFDTYISLPEPFTLDDVKEKIQSNSGAFTPRIHRKMEIAKHNEIIRLIRITSNSLICHGDEWLALVCFEKSV
jgi:hypothetical protein